MAQEVSKARRESNEIVLRFFEAVDTLKEMRKIRGVKTFTDMYDINRRNFTRIREKPSSGMFELSWIVYIERDFGVSMRWIMTGRGEMFK